MINLLPIEEKKALQTEKKWKLILLTGILILSFFLCLILILAIIKLSISEKTQSQGFLVASKQKEFKTPEIAELRDKISLANKNLFKINNFYESQVYLTDILEKISATLSDRIQLTSFSYREEGSIISLSGFAPDMDALSNFKNNLEENFATQVDVLLQSWTNPNNFQLTFKIPDTK